MTRTIWIAAAMAFPMGLMGCKDSNTTIVFDATASDSKGVVVASADAGGGDKAASDGAGSNDDGAAVSDGEQGQ